MRDSFDRFRRFGLLKQAHDQQQRRQRCSSVPIHSKNSYRVIPNHLKQCSVASKDAIPIDMHGADSDKHAEDDRLFERCMEQAQKSGVVECNIEFGDEVASFVPFANWLNAHRHLDSIRIRTFAGMRPYYFFLDDLQIEFKETQRKWEPPDRRIWPGNDPAGDWHRSKYHLPPDFRARSGIQARTLPSRFCSCRTSLRSNGRAVPSISFR
jgi:hypothetical protein